MLPHSLLGPQYPDWSLAPRRCPVYKCLSGENQEAGRREEGGKREREGKRQADKQADRLCAIGMWPWTSNGTTTGSNEGDGLDDA